MCPICTPLALCFLSDHLPWLRDETSPLDKCAVHHTFFHLHEASSHADQFWETNLDQHYYKNFDVPYVPYEQWTGHGSDSRATIQNNNFYRIWYRSPGLLSVLPEQLQCNTLIYLKLINTACPMSTFKLIYPA